MAVDITALYCCLDDFCKVFADWEAHRLIASEPTSKRRNRQGKLSRSEMLFIMVLFTSRHTRISRRSTSTGLAVSTAAALVTCPIMIASSA